MTKKATKAGCKAEVIGHKKPKNSYRRIHITSPLTAHEIREALNISKADLKAARQAIESVLSK